jgi:hypothetical protein
MLQNAGGFTDIGPEDLAARAAQGLGGRNAGDLLGGPVKEGDAPVEVNGEDPVNNAVQDSRGLGRQDRWSRGVTQARAAAFDGPGGFSGWISWRSFPKSGKHLFCLIGAIILQNGLAFNLSNKSARIGQVSP